MNQTTEDHAAQLFATIANCLRQLRGIGVVRGHIDPGAEYAEWLVAQKTGAQRGQKNQKGWDLVLRDGIRIQVKHQQKADSNAHRHCWYIAEKTLEGADRFVLVDFDAHFSVRGMYIVDKEQVQRLGHYREKYSDWQLRLRDLTEYRLP